jgi:hypothetical protein
MSNCTIRPVKEYNAEMMAQSRFNMTFHNNQGKAYKSGFVVVCGANAAYFKSIELANHFASNPVFEENFGSTPEGRMNS